MSRLSRSVWRAKVLPSNAGMACVVQSARFHIKLSVMVAVLAGPALAAPVFPAFEIVSGEPDGGSIVFPITAADGGANHAVRLRSTGNTPLDLDAITVTGDPARVFEVEGVLPSRLQVGEERTFTFHFKPFNQTGTFAGRVVIDWDGYRRDEHLNLCGTSLAEPDGGVAGLCEPPPPLGDRPVPTYSPQPGCTTGPGVLVRGAVLLVARRLRSSRARAGSDRSRR